MENMTVEGVEHFLLHTRYGTLSTVRKDGSPDGAIMYFLPVGNMSVRLITKVGTQKYENIQENKEGVFTIVDESELSFLQLRGKVSPVELSPREFTTLINALGDKLSKERMQTVLPILKHKKKGRLVALELTTEEVLLRAYADEGMHEFFLDLKAKK